MYVNVTENTKEMKKKIGWGIHESACGKCVLIWAFLPHQDQGNVFCRGELDLVLVGQMNNVTSNEE